MVQDSDTIRISDVSEAVVHGILEVTSDGIWDWNIRNDGPGIAVLFNVHFIDDKVVRTSQTYVYPRDGAMFGGRGGYYAHPWAWGPGWWGYPRPFYPHPFAYPWYW